MKIRFKFSSGLFFCTYSYLCRVTRSSRLKQCRRRWWALISSTVTSIQSAWSGTIFTGKTTWLRPLYWILRYAAKSNNKTFAFHFPLTISSHLSIFFKLCASAQYWANILAHRDEFHSQNPVDVGENLFEWPVVPELERAHDLRGRDVATWWYKTQKNYYFTKSSKVQHIYGGRFEN